MAGQEPYDYYGTQRSASPGWVNQLTALSVLELITVDLAAGGDFITPTPLLLVHGRTDAYCELHINSWDVLAGLLLIQEAGGWTNDFLAGDGLRRGNPVLGCTPALKDIVAEAMDLRR